MTSDTLISPTATSIVIWIACAVAVIVMLGKSWPTLKRWFGIGDAIGGLPELTEQVGLLATNVVEMGEQICRIENEVSNDHTLNLRDDMDSKHSEVIERIQGMEDRMTATSAIVASVLERQTEGDKALVRLWERIDFHHPPAHGSKSE